MNVDCTYIQQISEAETVFDMAAVCYKILEEEIINPVGFISRYIDESETRSQENPNCRALVSFSDFISERLEKYSELDFPKHKGEIVCRMRETTLAAFQEDKENQLTVVFMLLSTIDSLVPFWEEAIKSERVSLNKGKSRDTYLVYLSCRRCIHKELVQEIGRERKSVGDFGETLDNLLFLKRQDLPKGARAPEVSFLFRKAGETVHAKIAIIPGIQGTHFKIEKIGGSTEVIRYINELQIKSAERIWSKMQTAIQCGTEFIILPEFCVSEEILIYLKKKLSEHMQQDKGTSKLIAVFPGSTWIQPDDNVQFILDAWGREIGRYYKNTPFRKKKRGKKGYERCEGLTHPGHETSLLRVEGIGHILPATCRDVIDGKYTEYLIRKFLPAFLFVPAWSSSGSSFERPLKELAADYFTSSVLCNSCGALCKKTSVMGGAAVPCKNRTVAAGHFRKVQKTELMAEKCRKDCGEFCSYILDINFGQEVASSAKRISCRKYE